MKRLFILAAFFSQVIITSAQLTVSSANITGSICYNDGTLSLNITGGTAPYQSTITSGPSLPNVTYPVSPDNGNTYLSLHAGTYTVHITDGAGNSINYTVVIPGNYQFPFLADTVHRDSIVVYPSLGLAPYSFAISTSGPNGPFGAYQSSNVFDSLCNGTYYVRVIDSCGNFFTTAAIVINQVPVNGYALCYPGSNGRDSIHVLVPEVFGNPPFTYVFDNGSEGGTNTTGSFVFTSTCPDTIRISDICNHNATIHVDCHPLTVDGFCSNFTDSTATFSVTGGSLPYTFRYYEYDSVSATWVLMSTQSTGQYPHLPYSHHGGPIKFEVTDACGRIVSRGDSYLTFSVDNDCPFNGKVYLNPGDGVLGSPIAICSSCIPPDTLYGPPPFTFTNMDTGFYTFRVIDGCGEIRDKTFHVPVPKPIKAKYGFTSCNDVTVIAYSSDSAIITTGVTFTLFKTDNGMDSITQNTTGLFQNLPTGSYLVNVHYTQCLDASVTFYIPHLDGYCVTPFFDTQCHLRLIAEYGPDDFPENYSLVDSGGVVYNESPAGPDNGIFFNIPTGLYTLVSDSGCSVNQNFNFNFNLNETHYTNCLNQGTLMLTAQNVNYALCASPYPYRYFLDSAGVIIYPDSSFADHVTFTNLTPGIYIARAYLDTVVDFNGSPLPNGNKTCLLDSIHVLLPPYTVPAIITQNVNVCGANDSADIPFTIVGGFAPYHISIAGYPSINTSTLSGALQNIPIGNYTMIINDACGISSSISVSVIDSCLSCASVQANFTVNDSTICEGVTVAFQNSFTTGTTYAWTMDSVPFSNAVNPTLTINNAGDRIIQCIITYNACRDTFSLTVHVAVSAHFDLGNDTLYCGNFSRRLSSGILATHWSTGVTDSFIVVTSPGLYWGDITGNCGVFSDSIRITQGVSPVFNLGNDSVLCNGDAVTLTVTTTLPYDSLRWNNSSTSASITVNQTGSYFVRVYSAGCVTVDTINFSPANVIPHFDLGNDTFYCDAFSRVLTSGVSTTVWSTGVTASSITVSSPGLYWGANNDVCETYADTISIVQGFTPVFNLGIDSVLCDGDSVVLSAANQLANSVFLWSTGSTNQSITVNQQGEYAVTVTSTVCSAVDSVLFQRANIDPDLLQGDTNLCFGVTLVLTPRAGTNPVWQDGSQESSFTVSDSGTYTVTVNSLCGNVTDSVKVDVEICPSELHVPGAFTPNGDGTNDHFTVFSVGISEYDIKIYNRWGELVYHSSDVTELNDLTRGWNGVYKGNLQELDVFVYQISTTGYDGKNLYKKGNLTLIR